MTIMIKERNYQTLVCGRLLTNTKMLYFVMGQTFQFVRNPNSVYKILGKIYTW